MNSAYYLQLFFNILVNTAIYALAASGIALCYGVLKSLNFAHGTLIILGGYLFYLLLSMAGLPILTSLVLLTILLPLISLVFYIFAVKPFLHMSPSISIVATLAIAMIIEALLSIYFGVEVKSISLGQSHAGMEFYGAYITPIQIIMFVTAIIALSIVALVVRYTAFGRLLRAYADRPASVASLSYSGTLIAYLTCFVSVALAFLAGIFITAEYNIQPSMGNALTIKAFAALILGGLGSIFGALLGAFLLSTIEVLVIGIDIYGYSLPTGYKDAASFAIIITVLLIRPHGLLGKSRRTV